jgi:type IV secretory pathway VirB10-like protein
MNHTMRLSIVVALASAVALGTAAAQSSQNGQSGQSGQNQQTQPKQGQAQDNTGVSNPPPDSTIQADEMPAPPAPAPKPSPAVPATASQASGAQTNAAPVPAQTAQTMPATQPVDPGDDIVSGPAPATANTSTNLASGQDDNNPDDFGIVTSVPPPAAATTPDGWNPDNAIVTSVPVDPNALAEGTNITVRLKQDLSTKSTQAGATFSADVTQNVYNGSQLVIPAGSEMRGRVMHVSQGHRLVSRATIRLRPDMIVLPDGTAYHLYATAVESKAPGTSVNDEGGIVAGHHYKKDAVEYGAGAGVGAATGGAFGGPVGAGVGSLVGTGLVGTHMLTQPPAAADLPQGSVLIFSLTEPMPLTPTKN